LRSPAAIAAFERSERRSVVTAAAREYRAAMTRLAAMHHFEVWYLHVDVDALRGHIAARASSERLRLFEANVAKMRRKPRMRAFSKLTERVDGEWSGGCRYEGAYRDEVLTSLIVLKGDDLGDDRGGDRSADDVVAGGPRRRAQLGLPLLLAARRGAALEALLDAGYTDEALGLP
jgi:hypothetical protein